jgi:hypothetical protein
LAVLWFELKVSHRARQALYHLNHNHTLLVLVFRWGGISHFCLGMALHCDLPVASCIAGTTDTRMFVEMGSYFLPGLASNLPISASKSAEIIGVSHCTWSYTVFCFCFSCTVLNMARNMIKDHVNTYQYVM